MSNWLTLGVALIYLYVAVEHLLRANYGLAITFFGFAIGNVGMAIVAR